MSKSPRSILVVFANPRGTNALRLGAEDRAITEAIRLSKHRSSLRITRCHATTVHDLSRALLDAEYEIVHISGHGTKSGLVLELEDGGRHVVPQAALADLLEAYAAPAGRLQCAILNACYSLSTGVLASLGVPHTIAMEGAISDDAAVEFSRGFYDAIGAGKSINFAYEEGRRRVNLAAPGAQFVSVMLASGESRAPELQVPVDEIVRGEQDFVEVPQEPRRPVLMGWAIDLSGSMKSSIRNDSGGAMTRLESFRRTLDRLAADAKAAIRERRVRNEGEFNVFAYGFGFRHRDIEHADLFSLLQVARDTVSTEELERLKRHHTEAVKREYESSASRYSGLGSLARRYGFGSTVDAIQSGMRARGEDEVRQRVFADIADRIAARLRDLGETTLSLEDFSRRWEDSGESFANAEALIYGATPMRGALDRVKLRLERELRERPRDTAASLFVLSDGEPTDGSPIATFQAIRDLGVTIIACFVTGEDVADPRTLHGSPQPSWPSGARLMFDAASEIVDDSDIARFLLRKGWTLRPNARLFVQLNHSTVLDEFMETLLVPLRQRDADWQLPAGDRPSYPC